MADPTPVSVPLVTEVWGLFKSLRVARRNLLELIPEIATRQPIVSGKTGKRWHMVMDPGALRRILKDRLEDYPKSDVTKNILRPAIGDSLFIAEGANWHWQRRAAAPVFQHRHIKTLAPIMSSAVQSSCDRLDACIGQDVDLFKEMIAATFDVIGNVTLSDAETFDGGDVQQAIDAYIAQTAKVSFFDIIGVPSWVPRPSRLLGPNALTQMKRLADRAIEARRTAGPKPVPDLLDLLLASEDPQTKRQMSTSELRDNLLTFFVAGHETTALSLCWALYLCAFDPQVQTKLRAEVRRVLNGRVATAEDVADLVYTRQVIEEALRLYPPAAFLSRTAQVADRLCDRDIHPGDTVVMPIYALHRNKLLWDRPDHFDPDRFQSGHTIDRFAYLPFGDGPRICIGAHFAMMEAQIMLATLVSRFQFTAVEGKDPKPVLLLTLRPEGGVWLKVQRADDSAA